MFLLDLPRRNSLQLQRQIGASPKVHAVTTIQAPTAVKPVLVRFFLAFAAIIVADDCYGSQSTWFFKVVDLNEDPIPETRFLWKQRDSLDWNPVTLVTAYGEGGSNGRGEKLWRVRDMVPDPNQIESVQIGASFANYQLFLATGRLNDWFLIKVVAAGFRPIELKVAPSNNGVHWQRVMLMREPDLVVSSERSAPAMGSPIVNTISPVIIQIQVGGYSGNIPRGARVTVTAADSQTQQTALVDADGTATIRMPLPGKMIVDVTCAGFKPAKWRLNAAAGEVNKSFVQLSRM